MRNQMGCFSSEKLSFMPPVFTKNNYHVDKKGKFRKYVYTFDNNFIHVRTRISYQLKSFNGFANTFTNNH